MKEFKRKVKTRALRNFPKVFACILAAAASVSLIMPGVTLAEEETEESHAHTDECYKSPAEKPHSLLWG